jgi:DNA processing protein
MSALSGAGGAGGMRGRMPAGEREARMAWSRITEPADKVAFALISERGAEGALAAVVEGTAPEAARLRPRLEALDIDHDHRVRQKVRARVVVPGDDEWPTGLDDLEVPPHCLWVRGPEHLAEACERSAAVVGARSATAYGESTAGDIGAGLCERNFSVVSGAAFGIDGAAHRGALAVDGTTIAVLAGGVERPYPPSHRGLIDRIGETGAVVSEVPPGCAPTRWRFLKRNRLIAAMTRGTVVVEAGLRSGSRSTAAEATRLSRVVAAVPGPVTSMVSAGCHELIRSREAELVTDAAEVAELLGEVGRDLAPLKRGPERPGDGLGESESVVWSALPVRAAVGVEALALRTALAEREVIACLGRLQLQGLARRDGDGWRRPPRQRSA